MIILGIDPGSRKTGFAIIELIGRKMSVVDSGVLRFDHIGVFLDRIPDFYSSVKSLVQKYRPDEVALESLIFAKSPTALIKLAEARGAMLAAISETHKGRIFEYSPNLVKSVATGYGHAKKENVGVAMNMILGVRDYDSSDESDALAVAVCHSIQRGISSVVPKGKKSGRGLAASVKHKVKT